MDDFLLCEEVWEMISPLHPTIPTSLDHQLLNKEERHKNDNYYYYNSITKQDHQQAFSTCLIKEVKYMPGLPYLHLLHSNHFLSISRPKLIHSLIQIQRRFNLSIETVFNAVNYVDRFIYLNKSHDYDYKMMEMLSVASLSIACKFCETCPPSLQAIKEGLEHCVEARDIQRMELKILMALGWEVNCTTSHSYVEFITWELNSFINSFLLDDLTSRLKDVLLTSLVDDKLLEFRPSVIAMCGLRYVLEQMTPSTCHDCISHIATIIPHDQTENVSRCYAMIKENMARVHETESRAHHYPSSPDTVLIDLSFFHDKKRKREEEEEDGCLLKK